MHKLEISKVCVLRISKMWGRNFNFRNVKVWNFEIVKLLEFETLKLYAYRPSTCRLPPLNQPPSFLMIADQTVISRISVQIFLSNFHEICWNRLEKIKNAWCQHEIQSRTRFCCSFGPQRPNKDQNTMPGRIDRARSLTSNQTHVCFLIISNSADTFSGRAMP